MRIRAGRHWEFPISIVGRSNLDNICDLVTFNINKGAIIVVQVFNQTGTILTGWYDGYGGPKINDWGNVYIWNSKELTTTGKPKTTFTINKKDLEALL